MDMHEMTGVMRKRCLKRRAYCAFDCRGLVQIRVASTERHEAKCNRCWIELSCGASPGVDRRHAPYPGPLAAGTDSPHRTRRPLRPLGLGVLCGVGNRACSTL